MTAAVPEKTTDPVRKRRRIGLWISTTLLAIVAAVLIALPYVIRDQAVAWLQNNGAQHAKIDSVHVNVFTGTFGVNGLVVERDGGTPLQVRELRANLSWLDLFKKRVVVESLWLYGAHLSVVVTADKKLSIGGITLPVAQEHSAADTDAATSAPSAWTVGVPVLVLADSSVKLQTPQLDQNFALNTIYVLDMRGWEPQHAARIGVDAAINGRPLWLGSDVHAFADTPAAAAQIELDRLDLSAFRELAALADVKELAGTLSLKLALQTRYASGQNAGLQLDGDVVLRDVHAVYGANNLDQRELRYSGKTTVTLAQDATKPLVETEGELASAGQAAVVSALAFGHEQFVWKGTVRVMPKTAQDAAPAISAVGQVRGSGVEVDDTTQGTRLASVSQLALDNVNVALPDQIDVAAITIGATTLLDARDSSVAGDARESSVAAAAPVRVKLNGATVAGVRYDLLKKVASVKQVTVADLDARDVVKKLTLANAVAITVDDIAVALSDRASVKQVRVAQLSAVVPDALKSKKAPPLVAIGDVGVEGIEYAFAAPRLTIDTIALNDLLADVARDKSGVLRGISQLTAEAQAAPAAASAPVASATPRDSPALTVRLAKLTVGGKSSVKWIDHTVKPAAKLNVQPLALTFGPLDTADIDLRSDVKLSASLHKHNEIRFAGYVSPLSPKPTSKLDGVIKQLELTLFAPYAAAAGNTLRSGRLDAEIIAKVDHGELDAVNKLVLTKLELEGGGAGQRGATSSATGMPLNVALGYLRDSEGRIKLDIPVTGDIRDPNFKLDDVMRLAMQAAAQEAAMQYLTAALQPIGTVMLVGKLAKKAADAWQLQPVAFAPGETTLDDTAKAYAEKISGILKSRPGVKLTVCGNATEQDRQALLARQPPPPPPVASSAPAASKDNATPPPAAEPTVSDEALIELADHRSKQFRDQLVDQHQVNPEQLFDCRPVFQAGSAEPPSIALGM